MIRKIFLPIFAIFFLVSCASADTNAFSITKLSNGLTVILMEDHAAALVGIDIWVKAGSGNETKNSNGVSHFIEHMVFGATSKRDAGELDLEMESLGATLDARTSRDWAHFNTTVSSRYLPKALEVLADAITNAQFREMDIEYERLVLLEEIANKQANPLKTIQDYLAQELYGSHPYALPIEGTPESVTNIKRQDILDYYSKYYTAANMAIVLVGDFDSQAVMSEINRAFSSLPAAPVPKPVQKDIQPISKQISNTIKSPFTLNYIALGFLGPPASDTKDVCAMDVLLTYLGFGYRSWMSEELKAKAGLVSEASADFITHREPGMISFIAVTSDANTQKAEDAILAKLAAIRKEGIPQGNLALAKRFLLGRFAFQNETYAGRANSFGFYYAISEPEFANKYMNYVQAVTNDDVIKAAQKYINPDSAVILRLVPGKSEAQR